MSLRPFLIVLFVSACSISENPAPPPIAPATPGTGGRARPPTQTGTGGTSAPTMTATGGAGVGTGGTAGGSGGAAGAGGQGGSGGKVASDAAAAVSDGGAVTEAGGNLGATWMHTGCNKAMLMFPKIDKNNGVFPPGSCPPPETLKAVCAGNSKLMAMNATASAFETGYVHPPTYASDEHLMTRWSSPTGATAWVNLDFGTEQTFKRVYLLWELAHAADYDVVVSNDNQTWTTIGMVRNGDGYQDILDVDGKGRYLRINGIRRGVTGGPLYGYSLFDLTACGQR